ncbi:MAG: hypothetical protein U5L09_20960 [Bacteroidales bacterium]|nr:hypothetical protein [Bacteroidales bacterium]
MLTSNECLISELTRTGIPGSSPREIKQGFSFFTSDRKGHYDIIIKGTDNTWGAGSGKQENYFGAIKNPQHFCREIFT